MPRWISTVVGLQFENLGLKLDELQQLVEILTGLGGELDLKHVAAEAFELHLVLEKVGLDLLGPGVGQVDLVDRHDQRNLGGLGVIDGLDRLRHHGIVGSDHEHDDVRHLGAAGAHGSERGVARRVDEGHEPAKRGLDLIGADVLRDAAGLARDHVGLAQGIEQRGLAVVDVAHDGDDRSTGLQHLLRIGRIEQAFLDVGFGDTANRMAEFLSDELGGIGIDHIRDLVHRALLHQHADDVARMHGAALDQHGRHRTT
ncbi:MAG: hypothetical protein FD152_4173, partial [Xanthobacteraceae bacterium]